jgi:hypothetical protein
MAYNIPPLINGKSYEWADIKVNILGQPITGITAIMYDDKQNMVNVMGAGPRPVSRGYGNFEPSAKITLLMEEVEALRTLARTISPYGSIQSIPEFDIQVFYLDPALTIRQHVLRNVRFMNNPTDTKSGDTSIPVEIEILISHVEYKQ